MTGLHFEQLEPGPREHFRLHALASAARVIEQAGRSLGSHEALLEQLPFVAGYLDELDELGALPADGAAFDWGSALPPWEARATRQLPIRALSRALALDFDALTLLMAIGLLDEDARFGGLFEALQAQPGQQRPTSALLNAWWCRSPGAEAPQRDLRRLIELGLIEVVNLDAPRSQRAFQVPSLIWDALRAELPEAPAAYLRHLPASALDRLEEPVVEGALQDALRDLPPLLSSGQLETVIVRGPRHNGRRTLLHWLARALGRGVLEVSLSGTPDVDRERLQRSALLALLTHTLPIVLADLGPGETLELPALHAIPGPLALVLGRTGGVRGRPLERSVTLTIDLPSPPLRAQQLARVGAQSPASLEDLARRFRMTSGNLTRAARLAQVHASLAGRSHIEARDLRDAARSLGRQALDTLCTRLPDATDWSHFASSVETSRELRVLENRCRHRERLAGCVGPAAAAGLNGGVRALFQGPSGTGKTLAARLIASSLEKDIYRVDLSAVVNKYIGETEKNLSRLFAAAEELDVILLFDEGDALLARRTAVTSANDRYANLETNFLLQRMESFWGTVIITTNAAELIDTAFQRRMDAVVEFRAPEATERWAIWQMHLPVEHTVDLGMLREVAVRCQLTGGQIRNAILHATLLALEQPCSVGSSQIERAVQREYRKSGAVCPLRIAPPQLVGQR